MKYTESKLTEPRMHKQEVAIQAKIQKDEVDSKDNKNVYCVIEQNILSKTSKILKAFNTEAKAKAFASSTNTTADYNLVIEPIKLE